MRDVLSAAAAVHPRMLVDPRHTARYVGTLASRVWKVQGSLLLRAALVSDEVADEPEPSRIRSVA
jgi:hypothetical protein